MARENIRSHQKQEEEGSNVAPTCGELRRIRKHWNQWKWSKRDEIIVLHKLFQYSGQNAIYTREFYNFVKNNMLSVELSENQLSYLIYALRKQYSELRRREPKDLDYHSLKILKLSEKIWGVGDEGWPKTKVLRDQYYKKSLQEYVVQELGFQVDCLTSSVVQEIKKDWEDFMFAQNEYRMMQQRFHLQLCELRYDMHKTQFQRGQTL